MPLFSLGERDHKESNATVGGSPPAQWRSGVLVTSSRIQSEHEPANAPPV